MDLSEWGKFSAPRGGKLPVTLSLGVVEGRADVEAGVLLRDAEAALKRAEQAGQNRVEPPSRPGKK